MKFQLNDRVQYIGDNPKFYGQSGRIIASRESPKFLPNLISGIEEWYPQNDSDYTVEVTVKGAFAFIINVSEEEIE